MAQVQKGAHLAISRSGIVARRVAPDKQPGNDVLVLGAFLEL
jgi:hypothetical protein